MSESNDERATELDQALAESQRLEREERDRDMARQQEVDERVADLLADKHQPEED